MTLLFGLLTTIGFGAGDFLGGLASKNAPVITVSFYSQLTAATMIGVMALFWGGIPTPAALGWGIAAGLAVGIGIVRYYNALAYGLMGVTATVMGVFSALVPFITGLMLGERPSLLSIAGVMIVVGALPLVTGRDSGSGPGKPGASGRNGTPGKAGRSSLRTAALTNGIIAGSCFGFSFVFVDLATTHNPLWPVFATAAGSLIPLFIQILRRKQALSTGSSWPLIVATGLSQGLGFIAFGLAVLEGLVSIVSVAGALSPIPTALIAMFVLGECLTSNQLAGIAISLAGITLLILG